MTRRIAYDFEFIEDGQQSPIEIVSVGLVDVDSTRDSVYLVNGQLDVGRLMARDWLVQHVAPWLPWAGGPPWLPGHEPRPRRPHGAVAVIGAPPTLDHTNAEVVSLAHMRDRVIDFILGPLADGERIELWADYGAYDHVALHSLWGGMMGRPERMPMWTHDLCQLAEYLDVDLDTVPIAPPARPHHAGDDALHNAAVLRWLDARPRPWPYRHGDPGE